MIIIKYYEDKTEIWEDEKKLKIIKASMNYERPSNSFAQEYPVRKEEWYKKNSIIKLQYKDGNDLHHETFPAEEYFNKGKNISKYFYLRGKKHNTDGPAVIFDNNYKEWWVDGKKIPVKTQKEFVKHMLYKLLE